MTPLPMPIQVKIHPAIQVKNGQIMGNPIAKLHSR